MTDPLENEPTRQLPQPSLEDRLASLETGQATMQATLNVMDAKFDGFNQLLKEVLKMQQDMYVDLRGRMSSIERDIHQIKQDVGPESFPQRLFGMKP